MTIWRTLVDRHDYVLYVKDGDPSRYKHHTLWIQNKRTNERFDVTDRLDWDEAARLYDLNRGLVCIPGTLADHIIDLCINNALIPCPCEEYISHK